MKKDKHHNAGNDYAKKTEPATSWLQVRVTPSNKARFVQAAQAENLKLSEWILKTLNNSLDT